MIRLVVAAFLALGIHAGLLWIEVPWTGPALKTPQSRVVNIDLVSFQKPVPKPPVQPKRDKVAPRPKPAPLIKPAASPSPVPRPGKPEPKPEPTPAPPEASQAATPEMEPDAAPEQADASEPADDRAVVQASVPRYDINPPPHYPRVARRRHYQGTVMLDVLVTVGGRVAQIRVARSSGHAILDKSAVKSVKKWHFTPARRAGRPFEMWVRVPVRYELR